MNKLHIISVFAENKPGRLEKLQMFLLKQI